MRAWGVSLAAGLCLGALSVVGCGGEGSGDGGNGGPAKAEAAVTEFVNTDNCDLATDAFVLGYAPEAPDAGAAREACKRDTTEGLKRGEYKVTSSEADGDTANVVLALKTGETREYVVAFEGGEWLVDDFEEKASTTKHKLGATVPFADSYELDGRGLDVRLMVTTVSFKKGPPPEYAFEPELGGTWWKLEARIVSKSSGEVFSNTTDFVVRDQEGQSFQGGVDYKPELAAPSIATGETVKGFLSFNLPKGSRPVEVLYRPAASQNRRITWIVR